MDVEVVLEEGKLEFSDTGNMNPRTMAPDELIVYNKEVKDCSTSSVQPHKYISWTEGKLVFRNDPIDVIARRLERWYNIDVEILGRTSEDLRWRATFLDDGLEEVLDLLKRSLPIEYKIINGGFNTDEIYSKKKVIITLKNK